MKKFRFRLEKMLQLKGHVEKEKQKILGQATQKVMDQEKALEEINWRRRNLHDAQRQILLGRINSQALSAYSRYYLRLRKDELSGNELLKVYRSDQAKKRDELVEATKQKKIYEKLKEHKKEAYYKEYSRLTQKAQDELASQMLQHKKSSRANRELPDNRT